MWNRHELRVKGNVRMSGMLKACVLLHEKIIFFYFSSSKRIFFFTLLLVPLRLKLATSVNVRRCVQPAVNCNVRTRSHQNASQRALKATTLWASYSWATASLLCYSCAPQNETNEIYKNILKKSLGFFLFTEQEPNFYSCRVEKETPVRTSCWDKR